MGSMARLRLIGALFIHSSLFLTASVSSDLPNYAGFQARGWCMTTGPSINPMTISGLPLVRSINGASLIN